MKYHIIPKNDTMAHVPSQECPCLPRAVEGADDFLCHNAADRREELEAESGRSLPGKEWEITTEP